MGDPIKGPLEIHSDPGDAARIVLDPNKADITAGGNGAGGDLIVKNAAGNEVIRVGQGHRVDREPQFDVPYRRGRLVSPTRHSVVIPQFDGGGSGMLISPGRAWKNFVEVMNRITGASHA